MTPRLQAALSQLSTGAVHRDIAAREVSDAVEAERGQWCALVAELWREIESYGRGCVGDDGCRVCRLRERVERMELGR